MKYKVVLSWIDKKTEGNCDYEKKKLTINLPLLVTTTFVHERLHVLHPDWSEKKVLKEEKKAIQQLTVREIKRLAKDILQLKGKKIDIK